MPPEVFGNVIHQLVTLAGISRAWKLRGVCHTFKATITYDVFAKQPVKAFGYRTQRIFRENSGRYLYYRSKVLLDAHPDLPNMVNDMVNHVAKGMNKDTGNEKETLRQGLCDSLQLSHEDLLFRWVFRHKTPGLPLGWIYPHPPFGHLDKLVAEICLGYHSRIPALMQGLPSFEGHHIFGAPLQLATKLGHKAVVKAILENISAVLNDLYDLRCTRDAIIMDIGIFVHPGRSKLSMKHSFMGDAVVTAICQNDEDLLNLLLGWYKSHAFAIPAKVWDRLLKTAITRSSLAMIQAVATLRSPKRGSAWKVRWIDYQTACEHNREDVVRFFLDQGHIDVNNKAVASSPLVKAVVAGHLNIVKILVEAGADVNYVSTWKSKQTTPILVAIKRRNFDISHYLLKKGSHMPQISNEWDERGLLLCYKNIKCEKMESGCRDFPSYTEFRGTFDQEISENILAIQPKGAFRSRRAIRLLSEPENMKHYLAYHVKNPRDVFLELPTKIREMVEYVTKEIEAEEDRQDRNILLEVCACVADTCRYTQNLLWISEPGLLHESWLTIRNEWRQKQCGSTGSDLDWHEKFIAALSVRAYELVARLLPDAPRYLQQGVWDYPISAAIRLGDSEMITLMLDVLDQEKGKNWKIFQMLHIDSIYNIQVGVTLSISSNHPEITALLLEYLNDYKSLTNRSFYREWVKLAIDCQNDESLKSLLQVIAEDSPYHILNRTFEQGCRMGSLNVVKMLLKYGQVQLHSSSNTSSALAASIRSGTVDMVREVVEAGADIDYAMTTHRIPRRPTITPLEYAIHIKKYDVVAYLVECGAKVPSESIWPSRGKILKVLQKAVEERKKKSKTSKAAKIAK
ncbi:unnamed protein product [Alternaria sp. RS040]